MHTLDKLPPEVVVRRSTAVRHLGLALGVIAAMLVLPGAEGVAHSSDDRDGTGNAVEAHHGAADEDGTEVCGPAATRASGFTDVSHDSVHAAAIRCMAGYDIIQGRSDGSFGASGDLTRGQMASLIARFMDASTPELDTNSSHEAHEVQGVFDDTVDSVHRESIEVLLKLGVTTGVSSTRFEPLGSVTRGQIASFLYRAFGSLGVEPADDGPSSFEDVPSGSVHARAIDALAADDIISGTSSSTFEPGRSVTRAQAATLLRRSAERLHQDGRWESAPWPGETEGGWNDPATWPDGRVPTADDDVIVDGHVVIDGNASARTVTVNSGSTLEFAADADSELQAFGNVVVEGALKMQPGGHHIDHALRFLDVNEDAFVGGGHDVLRTDTGLWFTGQGHAALAGTPRLPWTRAARSLTAGSTVVELEDSPEGWQIGDEVVITPTSAPGNPGFSNGYSEGRVTAVDGRTIELDTPLAYDHPRVNDQWGAEVMNMTRNVRIEGTPSGRAHVMFAHVHGAQHLSDVALRHMGPRQETEDTYRSGGERVAITQGVMGRYPLHFHHSFDGTVGSQVENVVVRESGFRAFVPHASNGITFEGTIAHDVFDEAYWWDKAEGGECCGENWEHAPQSDDIVYDHAIASLVKTDPHFRGYTLAGFELGHGANTSVTNSVAVGVQGNRGAAGFKWPGGVRDVPGHWVFEDNVSHNNRVNGIFVWDNRGGSRHLVDRSLTYHNGEHGIFHGAYSNDYRYRDIVNYGNGRSGLDLHAQGEIQFAEMVFDGGGVSKYGFTTGTHRRDRPGATLTKPKFTGYTDSAVGILSDDVGYLDIIEPQFDEQQPRETWFFLADSVPEASVYRYQIDGEAYRLHPSSSDRGEYVAAWNARVEPIDPIG